MPKVFDADFVTEAGTRLNFQRLEGGKPRPVLLVLTEEMKRNGEIKLSMRDLRRLPEFLYGYHRLLSSSEDPRSEEA